MSLAGNRLYLRAFPTRRASDLADSGVLTIRGEIVRHMDPHSAHALGSAAIYQQPALLDRGDSQGMRDRKSTRLNSSHANSSYAVFCLRKKGRGTDAKASSRGPR